MSFLLLVISDFTYINTKLHKMNVDSVNVKPDYEQKDQHNICK